MREQNRWREKRDRSEEVEESEKEGEEDQEESYRGQGRLKRFSYCRGACPFSHRRLSLPEPPSDDGRRREDGVGRLHRHLGNSA